MGGTHQVTVIGIGNPDRGDDGAGRTVARILRGTVPAGVRVVEHDGEATSLLALLETIPAAVLVDACVSGAPAGSVRRIDIHAESLPADAFGFSTHGFGLGAAIELGRALVQLPPRCIVYAIEGACFDAGAPLSQAVAEAVRDLSEAVHAEAVGLLKEAAHA